ncbi:MAG: class I SAM-dependent methyltransferase [Planctomycetota bacterium]|jgi:SAM-dependent methyltransferase
MSLNQNIIHKLKARYYPGPHRDSLDKAFCANAQPGMKVLDAGCGSARGCSREAPWKQMFIVGIDRDSAVHANPFCNETLVCDVSHLPFADASFDLIHCRWVIEHIREPLKTFGEFARVLKPGGRLLALTPNIFHYATIAAKLSPHRFHRWWHQGSNEPFVTYYRANSPGKIRRLCSNVGLRVERVELLEGPPLYLTRFWLAFFGGVLYERIVNSMAILSWMRQRILLEAILPPGASVDNKKSKGQITYEKGKSDKTSLATA